MRIGFTGAQGTGKTTVLKRIEKSKINLTIVPSTARAALAAGFAVNRDADPLSQLVTTVGRIAIEDRIHRESGNTISDRTPLDSLAYTTYQYNNEWGRRDKNEYYWQTSVDLVMEHMHKYDALFYFPVYWAPKDDGVRDPDVEYQEEIDGIIKFYLPTIEKPTFVMPNASTDERLRFFIGSLTDLDNTRHVG
jgi:hypothetical protein